MRTAVLYHGAGPDSSAPGPDAEYLAALPPDVKPAFTRRRMVLGDMPAQSAAKTLGTWLDFEWAAGRKKALISCWPHTDIGSGNVTLLDQDVADGKYDGHFKAQAAAIATFPGDVWYTLRSECNGTGTPNGPWATGCSIPYVYVKAWRRAFATLHDYGAKRVIPTWHPHPLGFDPWVTGWSGLNPWASKYYPGDKWVGAFATSIYDPLAFMAGSSQNAMLVKLCAQAVARGKPVILGGEMSCAIPGTATAACIPDYFDRWKAFVENHPEVIGFSYRSWDWRTGQGFGTWQDGRLPFTAAWAWWLTMLRQSYVRNAI